jgi:SCL-interrupting locus protein N-terminus
VPLLEIDPAASIAPIVGVWTAFDEISDITIKSSITNINSPTGDHDSSHENNAKYSNLSNTLSWAAMIRFLYNENIKDRVFISGDTFLLVSPIQCHE